MYHLQHGHLITLRHQEVQAVQVAIQVMLLQAILQITGQLVRTVTDTQHGHLHIHQEGQGAGLQAVT